MSKILKTTNRSDSPSTDSSSLADSAGSLNSVEQHEITNDSEKGTIYQYSLPSMAKTPPRLVNEVSSAAEQSTTTMKTYPRLPSIEPIYAGDSCIIDCISTEPTVKRSTRVAVSSVPAPAPSQIENPNGSKRGWLVVLILVLLLFVIILQVGIMYLLKYDNDKIRKELDLEIAKSSTCQLRCHNQLADYKKYLKHICYQKSSRKNQAIVDVLMQSNW